MSRFAAAAFVIAVAVSLVFLLHLLLVVVTLRVALIVALVVTLIIAAPAVALVITVIVTASVVALIIPAAISASVVRITGNVNARDKSSRKRGTAEKADANRFHKSDHSKECMSDQANL